MFIKATKHITFVIIENMGIENKGFIPKENINPSNQFDLTDIPYSDTLHLYVREAMAIKPLDQESSNYLISLVAEGEDARAKLESSEHDEKTDKLYAQSTLGENAREHFVRAHTALVTHISKRYEDNVPGVERLDLIQEGNIALIKKAKKITEYIPEDSKVSTYLSKNIQWAMFNLINRKKIHVSLEPNDEGEIERINMGSTIETDVQVIVEEKMEKESMIEFIRNKRDQKVITPHQAAVLWLRYCGDKLRTHEEVGEILGTSRANSHLHEKKAIERIKERMSQEDKDIFF